MLCSYQQLYNALPDLGKSSSYIQEDKFQAFCKEISKLAETYGLLDVLCIRLAHKHWSLAPDQIMYERDGHFKGQQASVTSPVSQQSLKEPYVPTWWLHSNGSYEGAEFTSDPRIISLYDKINAQPECLRQFLKIATTFGYQDYLVPGILTNTSSNTICVEHNVEGQSYVTEEEISQDQTQGSASVPTTWELICPVRVRGNCPRFEGCISIYTPVDDTQYSDSAAKVRGNCPRTEGCISIYTPVEEIQGSGSVVRVRGNCPRVEGCISIYTPVDE